MKAKKVAFLIAFLSIGLSANAQKPVVAPDGKNDQVLFTVGGQPVTVEEFRYIYEKNNSSDKNLYTEKNLREYLELYSKFKLKVKAAHEMGLDTTEKFKREFANYRSQLAQPYLSDRQVTQHLVDEAYERMKWELRASHILIGVGADAAPKDTLAAYRNIMAIRQKLMQGADFEKVARDSSDDPSVASNGGDLGYFSVFQMVYPFESGAYNLKDTGKISMPVRTRFGYHLIRLTDRRPYRGEIQVRHILLNSSPNDPIAKQQLAKSKIDSLYSMLNKGGSFSELARQYSEHAQSRNAGGELPKFNSFGNYPEVFKDEAFALKNNGDYSKPFRSNFGWHLVQRISYTGLPEKKDIEEMLKNKIAKDSRSEQSREAALAKFKKEYNFQEKGKAVKKFNPAVDSSLLHGQWKSNSKVSAKTWMFKLNGKKYTQADFANYLEEHQQDGRYHDPKMAVRQYLNAYESEEVLGLYDRNLESKFPEFRNVANEYKEGILLFEVTDQKVWSKAMTDTLGQKAYFENNRDKYRWKERADAIVVDLRNANDVPALKKMMSELDRPEGPAVEKASSKAEPAKGKTDNAAKGKKGKTTAVAAKTKKTAEPLTMDSIALYFVKKDPLSLNYRTGLFERGEIKALDTVKWTPGIQEAGKINDRYYVVKINRVLPSQPKQLNDVRGLVIADYQDQLEKQWVAELRQKYPVQINEQVVQSLIKK